MRHVAATLGFLVLLAPTSGGAHHSFDAQFDAKKPIMLTGSLTKLEWTNPHIYLYLDVTEAAGQLANWAIELENPTQLMRLGWTRHTLKVGDVITIDGSLARDGSKLVNARTVLLDGKKLFAGRRQ